MPDDSTPTPADPTPFAERLAGMSERQRETLLVRQPAG